MSGELISIERIRAAASNACLCGAGIDANPYPEEHDAHAVWNGGYVIARDAARERTATKCLAA